MVGHEDPALNKDIVLLKENTDGGFARYLTQINRDSDDFDVSVKSIITDGALDASAFEFREVGGIYQLWIAEHVRLDADTHGTIVLDLEFTLKEDDSATSERLIIDVQGTPSAPAPDTIPPEPNHVEYVYVTDLPDGVSSTDDDTTTTLTSASGSVETVYYRFASTDGGAWVSADGTDTINNFRRGEDKLIFLDTDDTPIDLDTFLHANNVGDAGGQLTVKLLTTEAPTSGVTLITLTGIEIQFASNKLVLNYHSDSHVDWSRTQTGSYSSDAVNYIGLAGRGFNVATDTLTDNGLLANYFGAAGNENLQVLDIAPFTASEPIIIERHADPEDTRPATDDIFLLDHQARAEDADIVEDFGQGQDRLRLNYRGRNSEFTILASSSIIALQSLFDIRWAQAHETLDGITRGEDDAHIQNTIIYGTKGTASADDDTILMVLEDYDRPLTIDDFELTTHGASEADDTIIGAHNHDTINALGGDDIVRGHRGNDAIYGGAGDDSITGDAGGDFLAGEAGDDTLKGGADNDYILGGAGSDRIEGGAGDDIIAGGSGFDRISGGAGDDRFILNVENPAGDINNVDAVSDFTRTNGNFDRIRVLVEGDPFAIDSITKLQEATGIYWIKANRNLPGDSDNDENTADIAFYHKRGTLADISDDAFLMLLQDYDADLTLAHFELAVKANANSQRLWTASQGTKTFTIHQAIDATNLDASNVFELRERGDNVQLWLKDGQDITQNHEIRLAISEAGATSYLTIIVETESATDDTTAALQMLGDNLFGDTNPDTLDGMAGDDGLYGGGGNDLLRGGEGSDALYGGDDNDRLYGGAGDDTIYGGADDDLIQGAAGDDIILGHDGDDFLYGGAGSDALLGAEGRDTIYGNAGDDVLYGDSGNDRLDGGAGNDLIYGGLGDDVVYGGAGDDEIIDSDGDSNIIHAGAGRDFVDVISGTIFGGKGADLLRNSFNPGEIYGGDGIDYLLGRDSTRYYLDTREIEGNTDIVYEFRHTPSIFEQYLIVHVSEADKALIDAESGDAAKLTKLTEVANLRVELGTTPADIDYISETRFFEVGFVDVNDPDTQETLIYHTRGTAAESDDILLMVIEDHTTDLAYEVFDVRVAAAGFDANGADTLAGNEGVRDGSHIYPSVEGEQIRGTYGTDTIEGTAQADTIFGRAGDDTIYGENDADIIYGGIGDDTIFGGRDDTIYGGSGQDAIVSDSGAGDRIYGGNGDDFLVAGDTGSVVYGGNGIDFMRGALIMLLLRPIT